MPTCLSCGENIDVEDWDYPIEWETHSCENAPGENDDE